jgi:hypothetical protein
MNSMAQQTIDKLAVTLSKEMQGFTDIVYYSSRNGQVQTLAADRYEMRKPNRTPSTGSATSCSISRLSAARGIRTAISWLRGRETSSLRFPIAEKPETRYAQGGPSERVV